MSGTDDTVADETAVREPTEAFAEGGIVQHWAATAGPALDQAYDTLLGKGAGARLREARAAEAAAAAIEAEAEAAAEARRQAIADRTATWRLWREAVLTVGFAALIVVLLVAVVVLTDAARDAALGILLPVVTL
jgi:hypothetical protein